ncbi:hypothetical protein SISNIDRAFT_401871, partial [Sistotremastrum niveocremeum HHB9708]
TPRFRDALLPDHGYITAFPHAGWTNDVMGTAHLILLALLTRRTPIIPPYHPSHLPKASGLIRFGEIFDVKKLSAGIHIPVLEWDDVKNMTDEERNKDPRTRNYWGGEKEEVGCWALWPTQGTATRHRGVSAESVNLDVSWTPVPFGHPVKPHIIDWNLHALAELGFPEGHKAPELIPFPNSAGHQIDPDEQLFCLDFIYFVGLYEGGNEWWRESGMIWHSVARHMHWAPPLRSLAHQFLSFILDVPYISSDPIPPYIAIHVRRNDFKKICHSVAQEECMAPLSAYAKRVAEVREGLREKGFENTSEEELKKFWKEVDDLGWLWVDHDTWGTVEKYGMWYTVLLEACIQSLGIGFVGTDKSTMSSIAMRRTQEWSGGVGLLVKWGTLDADAH